MPEAMKEQEKQDIFALDIGTRSIIGVVGRVEDGRLHVLAIEKENHGQRAMLDGQIENIGQVARVADIVRQRLENRTKLRLSRVSVAAAGRALKSESASFRLEKPGVMPISEEDISQLEAGAVSAAERTLTEQGDQYYMVGYTVTDYRLDGYPMSSIREHSGRVLEADVVATFLPREVVESLYAVVAKLGLEVASLTLEPIAALNAAIPEDIRLLNLVLVDIGAGTSDIAACRDGSVVGYTMATVAGDEVTETLMRELLVDFKTGEQLKLGLGGASTDKLSYTDILSLPHEVTVAELTDLLEATMTSLAAELARRILDLNGKAPSAVFLAGGGCKLAGLRERVAEELKMNPARVATAGNHYERNAYSEEYDLNDPEYATPLGIAISAGLGLINDSYMILLNGAPAKLFRSGILVMRDILLTNGYRYGDLIGRTGANLSFTLNGTRHFVRGALAVPPVILLNGNLANLTDIVHAGDVIEFSPARPGKDAARTVGEVVGEDFQGSVTVNGNPAALDEPVRLGDDIWTENGTVSPAVQEGPSAPPSKPMPAPGKPLRITLNGTELGMPGKRDGEPYYLMDLLQYSGLDLEHLNRPVELTVNGMPGQFSQKLNDNDNILIQ